MIVKKVEKLSLSIFLYQEIYFFGRLSFMGRVEVKIFVSIPRETR
jgi:hypothetical protein